MIFSRATASALPRLAALGAVALIAGCAADMSGYPSLSPRAIEKSAEAVPAEPAPPMPPTGSNDIGAIVTAARAAATDFGAKIAEARPAIEKGRGAAQGSDAWVGAQQAYSAVESARGGVGTALADLDRLHQEAVAKGDAARIEEVETAITQVQALDAEQQAALSALQP